VARKLARDQVEKQPGGERALERRVTEVARVEVGREGHALAAGRAVVAAHGVAHRGERNVHADVVAAAARLELEHVATLAAREVQHAVASSHVLGQEH